MSAEHWYRGYGLLFRSDIDLPELTPTEPGREDAVIRLGTEARGAWEAVAPDAARHAGFCDSPSGPVMRVDDVADFLVREGREIIVSLVPDADAGAVRLFLIGSAMGMLFHQRGQLVLHGAAVARHTRMTIFVGESGAGKSTLAAHLGLAGHAVLADDTLPLQRAADGRFTAWPGSRVFKLWQDAVEGLGHRPDDLERITNRYQKFFFPNEAVAPDRPVVLDEIILLERGTDAPQLEPVEGLLALQVIAENAYRPEYVPLLGRETPHFQNVAALSGAVRTYRLTRPWDAGRIAETVALLERHWQGLAQRAEVVS